MYGAREVQRQGAVACASFEYLEWWFGAWASGRSINMNVEQGHNEVRIRRVDLVDVSICIRCDEAIRIRTGVTRRGVSLMYSASVGSWMRKEAPLWEWTIWRGSLPITSSCLMTPLCVPVDLGACSFTRRPS